MRPLNKIKIKWSSSFAYAIGTIATDGNLSPDGRHINITSKDKEMVKTIAVCLGAKNRIGRKSSGSSSKKKYFVLQFGDVNFYAFLMSLGIMPRKSKTIGTLKIPSRFFFDFLRGHFDGDGTFFSYWDPRWKSSFMFYTEFLSASRTHIIWLQKEIEKRLNIHGHITTNNKHQIFHLKYAKRESLILLKEMYYDSHVACLERKRKKVKQALKIDKNARVL